nr:MAG TPA: hypothetical protein [Caudoviricetes sp.]
MIDNARKYKRAGVIGTTAGPSAYQIIRGTRN